MPDEVIAAPGPPAVVVFDYDGVCTPSAREYIASDGGLPALRPDLPKVLEHVRTHGSQTALLSNEFDRRWLDTIDGFPTFDHVFVGSDNKIFKPDRRAFQRVVLTVQCEPSACLVIDDDETNCRVAESIGCRTVLFDPADPAASWAAVLDSVATS